MDWLDIKEFFKDTFKYIIFIVVILFIAIYVVGLQQVVGPSMSPTLENGDVLILDKANYRFFDVKKGDVIALYSSKSKYLIKRVVGMPGEYVEFKNNQLYINNIPLEEEYLGDSVITEDFSIRELGYETIPEDMYLVLGDNRGDSSDSRDPEIGLIKKSDILGKVRFRIWPLNKIKIVK